MPLLTHDETGAASVARASAVALAERPVARAGGAERKTEPRSGWRRIRRWLLVMLLLAVIAPFLAFFVGWLIFEVPTADDRVTQVATFTYATDEPVRPADLPPEAILATVRPESVNRVKVPLEQVPLPVRNAVLAAEDSTFYSNPGFDISGIARAIYNQLTGGVGGGSTITQQYIKVTTGERDISLLRKYREVVLAVKISRVQTKDEILENYLNTIYFGRGAYGIQAASRAYFQKDVGQLTVSEGAMLAGIIQSPINGDPANDAAQTQRRWTFVVDQMVDKQWLTPADRASLVFPSPESWKLVEQASGAGVPGDDKYHIYDRAKAELKAAGITEDQINTLGLTVTTTVQRDRQDAAVAAVQKALKDQPENLRVALTSVDPKTGAIVAYYGGDNGVGTDYAGEALRQPGSSFKPFVVAAALQNDPDIGLGTLYDGTSGQTFNDRKQPVNNSEGFDCDLCSVKTAMTKSINTIFYKMAFDMGSEKVAAAAHQAGIPEDLLRKQTGSGIALGDREVHPLDMAAAFGTFAADGQRHDPYIVSRVEAADGRVLLDRTQAVSAGPTEIPQQVARNVTESMIDVAQSSGIPLAGGRPVAAKTGTVQHPTIKGQNKDAWTVGYTPSLSTAVWVGSDASDPIQMRGKRPIYGRMLPGAIWKQYMDAALKGRPVEQFSTFVPLGQPPESEFAVDGGGDPNAGNNGDNNNGDNGGGNNNGDNGGGNNNGGNGGGNNNGDALNGGAEPAVGGFGPLRVGVGDPNRGVIPAGGVPAQLRTFPAASRTASAPASTSTPASSSSAATRTPAG